MPDEKKLLENEKEQALAEKMRLRLHQSYNIECPKKAFKQKDHFRHN